MPAFRHARLALLLCAACVAGGNRAREEPASAQDWRQVATADDRARLRRWRDAWTQALARVRDAGGGAVLADTALFDPDRSLPDAAPPPGRYRCRVVKLGANGSAMRELTLLAPAACRVAQDGGATTIYKVSGVQRPRGTLYPDGPNRQVFLGTLVIGDETKPLAYGRDGRRDLAGYVERIGERRWRLVLPYPSFESLLNVIELTPEPADAE